MPLVVGSKHVLTTGETIASWLTKSISLVTLGPQKAQGSLCGGAVLLYKHSMVWKSIGGHSGVEATTYLY